ncbi:MAG: TOBE domain-containing protein [Jatrophihabitans sp.]
MNLYRGERAPDGSVAIEDGGSLMSTDVPAGPVLAALRPSAVTVHLNEPVDTSARNVWSATVRTLAPLGDRIRVTTEGAFRTTVDVTASAVAELGLAPGRAVWLSAKATDVNAYPRT